MSDTKTGLRAVPEIYGVILNSADGFDGDVFISSPRDYVFSRHNFNVPANVDLRGVRNESDVINLTLPYYSGVDSNGISGSPLSEEALADVSGGELLIFLPWILDNTK